jgi:hypothetical protein
MIRGRLTLPLLLVAMLVTACTRADDPKQKTMTAIEDKIELPSRALSLNDYVRVYAYLNPRVVVAAYYAAGPDGYDLNEVCFGDGRKEVPCGSHELKQTKLTPGQRLWIDHYENLPAVDGGGCGYIRVQYDVQTQHIMQAECNGPN